MHLDFILVLRSDGGSQLLFFQMAGQGYQGRGAETPSWVRNPSTARSDLAPRSAPPCASSPRRALHPTPYAPPPRPALPAPTLPSSQSPNPNPTGPRRASRPRRSPPASPAEPYLQRVPSPRPAPALRGPHHSTPLHPCAPQPPPPAPLSAAPPSRSPRPAPPFPGPPPAPALSRSLGGFLHKRRGLWCYLHGDPAAGANARRWCRRRPEPPEVCGARPARSLRRVPRPPPARLGHLSSGFRAPLPGGGPRGARMLPRRRRARTGSPGGPARPGPARPCPPRFPGVAIHLAEPRMGRSRRAFLTRLALSKGFRVLDAYRCAVAEKPAARGRPGAPARGAFVVGGRLHQGRGAGAAPSGHRGTAVRVWPDQHGPRTLLRGGSPHVGAQTSPRTSHFHEPRFFSAEDVKV